MKPLPITIIIRDACMIEGFKYMDIQNNKKKIVRQPLWGKILATLVFWPSDLAEKIMGRRTYWEDEYPNLTHWTGWVEYVGQILSMLMLFLVLALLFWLVREFFLIGWTILS